MFAVEVERGRKGRTTEEGRNRRTSWRERERGDRATRQTAAAEEAVEEVGARRRKWTAARRTQDWREDSRKELAEAEEAGSAPQVRADHILVDRRRCTLAEVGRMSRSLSQGRNSALTVEGRVRRHKVRLAPGRRAAADSTQGIPTVCSSSTRWR